MSDPMASRPPAFGFSSPANSGLDDELERLLADGDDASASNAAEDDGFGFDKPAKTADDDFDFGFDSDAPTTAPVNAARDDFDFTADLPISAATLSADDDETAPMTPQAVPVADETTALEATTATQPLDFDDFDDNQPMAAVTPVSVDEASFDDFDASMAEAEPSRPDTTPAFAAETDAPPRFSGDFSDDDEEPVPTPSNDMSFDDFDRPAPLSHRGDADSTDLDDELSRLVGADEAPAMLEADPFPHESGLAYGDEPESGLGRPFRPSFEAPYVPPPPRYFEPPPEDELIIPGQPDARRFLFGEDFGRPPPAPVVVMPEPEPEPEIEMNFDDGEPEP